MSIVIGKDCWNLIAAYGLSTKDLLSLRATCKYMNNIIKSMNEEWFKAYQWFLISVSNKNKAKSAVRVHNRELRPDCIGGNHPLLAEVNQPNPYGYGGWMHNQYNRKQEIKQRMIKNGEFTIDECTCRYHWRTVVPQSRNDIPHEGYNKKNQYIYYYLIECYRHYNKINEAEKRRVDSEIYELEPKVERYNYLLKRKIELSDKYKDNEIFKSRRVNEYKSI